MSRRDSEIPPYSSLLPPHAFLLLLAFLLQPGHELAAFVDLGLQCLCMRELQGTLLHQLLDHVVERVGVTSDTRAWLVAYATELTRLELNGVAPK